MGTVNETVELGCGVRRLFAPPTPRQLVPPVGDTVTYPPRLPAVAPGEIAARNLGLHPRRPCCRVKNGPVEAASG